MQGAQRGKAAAGPSAGTQAEDWLHLSNYESLHQVTGSEQVLAEGGIIIGYVIQNPTSHKPSSGELLPGTMILRRSVDSVVTPVDCSFLVVDTARRATDMFKAYLAISNKRLAKVYFTAMSKNVDSYVVCYEKLTAYNVASQARSIAKDKRTWQLAIRQIFETLDEMQKQNYGRIVLGSSTNVNCLYFGKNEDMYGFPPIHGVNNADIVKFISVVPVKNVTITDKVRKQQLTGFLDLIGEFGVRELDKEYEAFQSLVKERKTYNIPILLRHPFLLCSEKERVDIVPTLNEDVHGVVWANYETYMEEKLPGLNRTWKKTVREKGFSDMVKVIDTYEDKFQHLLRFLRNFVTHKRDSALQRDVNYIEVHASMYRPFGAFLSWTYTYIHE